MEVIYEKQPVFNTASSSAAEALGSHFTGFTSFQWRKRYSDSTLGAGYIGIGLSVAKGPCGSAF